MYWAANKCGVNDYIDKNLYSLKVSEQGYTEED